jgi:ADP-ribose pyrophosphatase YjhB (NUDIX family)
MVQLVHRVRLFVYSFRNSHPDYLLLRRDQGLEAVWTPLQGVIGFDEKFESAVLREFRRETGMEPPDEVIDLCMPTQFDLGDERVIEWNFAARAEPGDPPVALHSDWAAYRWSEFAEAFPVLEFEQDRAAIVRLHTLLLAR